ncbi:hypothetical protein ILUMI_11543 [Ignelater luminosus]|uniref:protein-tyrosine-phosphatase n=1 Tax=Ignelater luminosus TaxID=2038154 RepID=A0A8K0G7M1_IGNLU|nr:hypothetical protein ILUMI_11543 [Ignelater luminosus]
MYSADVDELLEENARPTPCYNEDMLSVQLYRFLLLTGLTLVLVTCSVLDCASTWRHIRQVPPIEASPESGTSQDDISSTNISLKEENIKQDVNSKIEVAEHSQRPITDNEKAEKNEVETKKKPKTETSTEKRTRDNIITVNRTNDNDKDKSIVDKKIENKNATSIEVPSLKIPDLVTVDTKRNSLMKESQKTTSVEHDTITTTEKVPENKEDTSVSRAENGRSLGIDISKYVSPEFHNKNNVYSFSVSPDTEKFTNLHNELPKSTTSRLSTQTSRHTHFGEGITTPTDDDFDKKYQNIEEGVKQKLEYIDHEFPKSDYDFKKSPEEPVNISKIMEEMESNDTIVRLNFTKFRNITSNNSQDETKVHKELDVESGQNVDYSSSYNKTQVYNMPPKDYKNKILTHEEEILSETLPEHSDTKLIQKTVLKPVDTKHLESEASNENIPEIINLKDGTSLTKPPPINQSDNHKSLLSNKIETEVMNPAENSGKVKKWDFSYELTTLTSVVPKSTTERPGQEEGTVYVPYGKDNLINVSKRGSTKFVDTVKITTTTESYANNKSPPTTIVAAKNKLVLVNKQALARKENKTLEQSVLENQVYPLQIPSPNKDQKEEKIINDTTEKSSTTEDSTLPLKLYTVFHSSNSAQTATYNLSSLNDQTETTTIAEDLTVSEASELTTYTTENSIESTTTLDTTPMDDETLIYDTFTELTTDREALEITTVVENSTVSESNVVVSTTTLSPTTSETESAITDTIVKNEDFTTVTYEIDVSTDYSDESYSQESKSSETISSEEGMRESIAPTDAYSQEYSDGNTTAYNYEDSDSTSTNSSDYSTEYDDRASNGRDLKGNANRESFSTIDDNVNNVDLITQSVLDKTSTTEKHLNTTNLTDVSTENESDLKATSDYRDNVIVKHTDTESTTKSLKEITNKLNISNDGEDTSEDTMDDYDFDHLNTSSRKAIEHTDERNSDTTPFIVPLNVSLSETDGTDATTVSENLELGSDDKNEGNGGQIAAIVISCIGAVCLIILAGLLFIMRKRHKRFNYGQRCTPVSLDAYSVDNVSVYNSMRRKGAMRASKRSYGNPAFDDPSSVSHSLNFQGLAKFASDTEGIGKEFEEIPQVTAQTNELPEGCETKNRYANVIPLPETRVFLNAIDSYPNSDYINANYVTGPKSTRGYYIACQAPMQNTVDDFWRMVWEQQSKVILMLTHLFENGTEKCVDYLPPSEVLDCHRLFGDFQVTLKKREVKEKYVISSLQLKNMVSNSWREVTHLWYLGWPEKGVPSEANSLIAFLIEARSYIRAAPSSENGKPKDMINKPFSNGTVNPEQSPVIVHCSPGTGRTGTVIACDIAIREFELARQVDIPKTVYRIRRDRASSVQTKEQYAFIYTVICLYATKLTGGVLDSL